MLSSDVLEQQFGPTQVEILYQDDTRRVVQTRAVRSRKILELSSTVFSEDGVWDFPHVHAVITAGESMGKAFREAGVVFTRETRTISSLPVPAYFSKRLGDSGAATVIEVDILVGHQKTSYARIAEVYSPTVRWPEPLKKPRTTLPDQLKSLRIVLGGEPWNY